MSIANRVHITKRTGASGGAQLFIISYLLQIFFKSIYFLVMLSG